VIRLANVALDEVRRRTQLTTSGHRGRKADPLYRIRRRLLASHDRLDPAAFARMLAWLNAGDPQGEVGAAYLAKEPLRDTYLAGDALQARRCLVAFSDPANHTSARRDSLTVVKELLATGREGALKPVLVGSVVDLGG
jgi:hypothetical protein